MNKTAGVALAGVLALVMGACAEGPSVASDVSLVEWTSSFGFCPPESYCTTRLRVTGTEAVVTLESRQSPTVSRTVQLGAAEADALAEAAAEARFDGLGPVIGCPDCADGGAETLSVTAAGDQRTVTFEYNAPVDRLEPLLGQVRGLVDRLRPPAP
jgi:hypothetical protein